MTGFAKGTVIKFIEELGDVCEEYHDRTARNLPTKLVQADEIWSFVGSKAKNVPEGKEEDENYGDVWVWKAIDKESKFMISWYVGSRDAECAARFIYDLSKRLGSRVQLTTDGHKVYERAVEDAFGWQIDYAMLVKQYGEPRDTQARYSPCECIGAVKVPISGRPDKKEICTSHIERENLSMRMGMRRFTRLTNAFSKKLANHRAAIAIHLMHYNFCRVHTTLCVTPAMEVGLAKSVWELSDMVALLEAKEDAVVGTEQNKRGKYKARS